MRSQSTVIYKFLKNISNLCRKIFSEFFWCRLKYFLNVAHKTYSADDIETNVFLVDVKSNMRTESDKSENLCEIFMLFKISFKCHVSYATTRDDNYNYILPF